MMINTFKKTLKTVNATCRGILLLLLAYALFCVGKYYAVGYDGPNGLKIKGDLRDLAVILCVAVIAFGFDKAVRMARNWIWRAFLARNASNDAFARFAGFIIRPIAKRSGKTAPQKTKPKNHGKKPSKKTHNP